MKPNLASIRPSMHEYGLLRDRMNSKRLKATDCSDVYRGVRVCSEIELVPGVGFCSAALLDSKATLGTRRAMLVVPAPSAPVTDGAGLAVMPSRGSSRRRSPTPRSISHDGDMDNVRGRRYHER